MVILILLIFRTSGIFLVREPSQSYTKDFGVVMEIDNTIDRNGNIKVKVYERNMKCNGTLQRKTYKFKASTGGYELKAESLGVGMGILENSF